MATRSRGSSASTHRGIPPGRPPRGATAILVAIVLVLLLGFLALALDSGHLFSVRGELQNAVDSGALAGAVDLDGTPDGLAPAVASGTAFAARHETDSHVDVVANQVELGHWTPPGQVCSTFSGVASGQTGPDGYQFCRIDARDAAAARNIDAVRVQAARAEGVPGGGGAPVFLHPFLGHAATADVATEAVAVSGGPCTQKCTNAPLVIRDDCLEDGGGTLRCGQAYTLGLSAATIDSAGFTSLSSQVSVNPGSICDVLQGSQNCALTYGEMIWTGNGNELSSAGCKPPDNSKRTLCEWFALLVGREMQIPVVDYGDGKGCYGGNYSGAAQVVGFATFRVAEVYCKGGITIPPADSPCAGYATEQCIVVQYICGAHDDEQAPLGCGWWGTSPIRPQLVR